MTTPELLEVEASPLRYILSVPPTVTGRAGLAPVLCFLHGYDEAAPTNIHIALTRHGPLRPESSQHATRDFIVVAPQLAPHGGDHWSRHAETVREIVMQITDAYGGDPRRLYLTGFSYGGNGVMEIALAQRGTWAALWPVDPTRVPAGDPGCPLWLSLGEVSRRLTKSFVQSLGLAPASKKPEGDRLYLDQGQDHTGCARQAYRDHRIYAWLLSKQRANPIPSTPSMPMK